jgi:hypothetical protein
MLNAGYRPNSILSSKCSYFLQGVYRFIPYLYSRFNIAVVPQARHEINWLFLF